MITNSAAQTVRRRLLITLTLSVLSLTYCRAFIMAYLASGEWRATDHLFVTGHDWGWFYFQFAALHRSLFEYHQWPFWNPWYLGGSSMWGHPLTQFPTPMLLLDVLVGSVNSVRLQVVLHVWIGLLGSFWLARLLGMSRQAALLAASIFMMSTWYSLVLAAGHANFWAAAYTPWVLGCLYGSGRDLRWALGAAAWLALVVFEGGNYIFLLFLVLVSLLTLAWTIQQRSWRPLTALLILVVFSTGFAYVRLGPESAMLAKYPRLTEAGGYVYQQLQRDLTGDTNRAEQADLPINTRQAASTEPTRQLTGPKALFAQLCRMFLGRQQEVGAVYYRYQGWGWHAYGAYIGPVGLLLLLFFPLVWRRQWPWMFGAAGCFLIALGNFGPFSPWALLHHLPYYDQSRVPSRYLIPCVLCLGITAGWVFDALWQCYGAQGGRARALLVGVLIVGVADLAWTGGRSFHNEKEYGRVTAPRPPSSSVLTVVGGRSEQMLLMFNNYRTRNGFDELPITSHVAAVGDENYRGEFYAVELDDPTSDSLTGAAPGSVEVLDWSPNRIMLRTKMTKEGWIICNMNWDSGWYVEPAHSIESRGGLLAVRVKPGDGPITLHYVPDRLGLGLAVTLLTLFTSGVWLLLASRRGRPRSVARQSSAETT
jgi:hypothetical protein